MNEIKEAVRKVKNMKKTCITLSTLLSQSHYVCPYIYTLKPDPLQTQFVLCHLSALPDLYFVLKATYSVYEMQSCFVTRYPLVKTMAVKIHTL